MGEIFNMAWRKNLEHRQLQNGVDVNVVVGSVFTRVGCNAWSKNG